MSGKKDLIKYSNTFLKRIKIFFNKIFKKKQLEEKDNNITNNANIKSNFTLDVFKVDNKEINKKLTAESNRYQEKVEKDKFFKLYYDYVNKRVEAKDIPFSKLIKINKMLNEEMKIMVTDYNSLESLVLADPISGNANKV